MDKDERLSSFQEELDFLQQRADRERKLYRTRAFIYKILAVALAAAITVLLGLNVGGMLANVFRDIALGFGAAITVLNAVDAFFDYRFLWMRETMLWSKLEALMRDFKLYALHLKPEADRERMLDEFRSRLDQILEEYMQDWFKLRQNQHSGKFEGH